MTNRNFEMRIALKYCEPWKEPVSFISTTRWTIAEKADWEWHSLNQIIIREGHDKVQALHTEKEILDYFKEHLEHYHKFCKYYQELNR